MTFPPATSDIAPTWVSCSSCGDSIKGSRFVRDLRVCPVCGWHSRLSASLRLEQLLDTDSARPVATPDTVDDPIGFTDTVPYRERLRAARAATGMKDAVLCSLGTIAGEPLLVAAMDARFLGGSLGMAAAERLVGAAERARREGVPFLLVAASNGPRVQEGPFALMQLARVTQAMGMLDEARIPSLSLVTDPTFGGTASVATLADVVVAEPGARMGFAGPSLAESVPRYVHADAFPPAEVLLRHGTVDLVAARATLRTVLGRLVALGVPGPAAPVERAAVISDPDRLPGRDAPETVRLARHPSRPSTLDYVGHMLEDFQELHGDRQSGDCGSIVGGVGRLLGRPVVVLGHQRGRTLRDRSARNSGMPRPAAHRKAARLMRLAAKLGLPVVTLVDTPGCDPGVEAERDGQAAAVAEVLEVMGTLPVPVVSVVTGEGGGGGALALGVADRVLVMQNAFYSVVSPESAAEALWEDGQAASDAARALCLDAAELLRRGVADAVVPEPDGGAHRDPRGSALAVRDAVHAELTGLLGEGAGSRAALRRARFARFGAPRRASR